MNKRKKKLLNKLIDDSVRVLKEANSWKSNSPLAILDETVCELQELQEKIKE